MEQQNPPQQHQSAPLPPTPVQQQQQQQQQQPYVQPVQQLPAGQFPQYQQYQQAYQYPQPQNNGVPAVHVSSRGMFSAKLALRIGSMISCLILLGLCGGLAVQWSLAPIVILAGPAGIAFIWNLAESICLCVRRGHRGIHPGAIVGVDLLLWLGYVVGLVCLGLIGGYSYYYYDSYYSRWGGYSLYRAVLGFGALEVITHFTLFVIGCSETHVRNRNSQVVFIQPTTGGAVMYPPPNVQMAQVYQPGYPQPPPPVQQQQQYQPYAPVQPRAAEAPSTVQNQQAQ